MANRNRYFTDLSRAINSPTLGDLEEAGQIAGAAADFTWMVNSEGIEDPRAESGMMDVCNAVFDLVHTIVSKYVEKEREAEKVQA